MPILDSQTPGKMLGKDKLVGAIGHTIRERKLTQSEAAKLIGIDQPEVSQLLSGKFRGYSCDRLMQFLTPSGQDVVIFIAPKSAKEEGPGHLSISLSHGF
jgi:predicted XRE-type DNA-binding protein